MYTACWMGKAKHTNKEFVTGKKWQSYPTGQCQTVSKFEHLAIGNITHYAARSSSIGVSGTVQVTVSVFPQRPDTAI
jgi:hypothetical protein